MYTKYWNAFSHWISIWLTLKCNSSRVTKDSLVWKSFCSPISAIRSCIVLWDASIADRAASLTCSFDSNREYCWDKSPIWLWIVSSNAAVAVEPVKLFNFRSRWCCLSRTDWTALLSSLNLWFQWPNRPERLWVVANVPGSVEGSKSAFNDWICQQF